MCSTLCKSTRLLQVSTSAQQVLLICSSPKAILCTLHVLHQLSKHKLCYRTSDTLLSAPATPGVTFVPPLASLMILSQLLWHTVLLASVSLSSLFAVAVGSHNMVSVDLLEVRHSEGRAGD